MSTTNEHDTTTEIVLAFYEPFRTGDTSVYDEVLAEDWIGLPLAPGQEQGPAGMAAQIALFRHAMPDYSVEHQDVIVQGDRVAVRNTVSGTHQGAFMGHGPTGKRIEMRTMDMHQVRDGRIVATWHLEDFAGLVAQLNAPVDAPTPAAWG
ncbi:ester cyclase [Curtobacterium sp. MCBD17_034]|uniref:ester cyclase n=1 Tax=unclassified Curtobacterium TaxID=257496 RepID=UPI000DAA2E9A|nr:MULTISPECIES: ester cyclase [unclassified Curtobacterium]PZF56398.1 ester cyclase [Curtobacterium sp. MCBD17_034]PZM33266.1 ester cyclase [Curtobacterium sp. MCBD17_031]